MKETKADWIWNAKPLLDTQILYEPAIIAFMTSQSLDAM